MISPTLVPVAKQISPMQVCFPPSPSPSVSRHGWIGSGGTQAALCKLERRDAFPSSSSFSLYSDPFILHWGLHSALQGELGEEGFLAGNCLPRSQGHAQRPERSHTWLDTGRSKDWSGSTVKAWSREVAIVYTEKREDPFQAHSNSHSDSSFFIDF